MFVKSLSFISSFIIFSTLLSCNSRNENGSVQDVKTDRIKMLNDTILKMPIKISCFKNNRLIEVKRDHILIQKLKNDQIVSTNIIFGDINKTNDIYSSFTYDIFNRFQLTNKESEITKLSNYSDIKLKFTISSKKIKMGKVKKNFYSGLPVDIQIDCETQNSYTRQFIYRIKLLRDVFHLKSYYEKSIKKEMDGNTYEVKFVVGSRG